MEEQDFGWALKQLRRGAFVFRSGWNGKGQKIGMQFPDAESANTLPYFYIITVEAKRVPWVASHTDLISSDWEIA